MSNCEKLSKKIICKIWGQEYPTEQFEKKLLRTKICKNVDQGNNVHESCQEQHICKI